MHRRPIILFVFLTVFAVSRVHATRGIDIEEVKKCYAANNTDDLPLVSWMDWGVPRFLLYPDGLLIVADPHAKNGLVNTRLPASTLKAALRAVSAQDRFWSLSSRYELSKWSDQPLHTVSVRIPGKAAVSVVVYGNLTSWSKGDVRPPEAFTQFIDALAALIPEEMQPWDPGYVEILWADYDYAPDRSLPWPKKWPGFDSPLVRQVSNTVVRKIMIFPSSHLAELDAFLARRPERGAILIDGKKMSASYRWPLRGEKQWSSWTQ